MSVEGGRRRSMRTIASAALLAAVVALGLALAGPISTGGPVADAGTCSYLGQTVDCWTLTIDLSQSTGSGRVQAANSSYQVISGIDCRVVDGVVQSGSVCSGVYKDVFHSGSVTAYLVVTVDPDNELCFAANVCQTAGSNASTTFSADRTDAMSFYRQLTVTLDLSGSGSGTVYSTDVQHVPDNDIVCHLQNGAVTGDSTCSHSYWQTSPTITRYLEMAPAPGNLGCPDGTVTFTCSSATTFITRNFSASTTVKEAFAIADTVYVGKSGAGTGVIESTNYPGINCGPQCSFTWPRGLTIKLQATPDSGWSFLGWTGGCAGQPASCSIKLNGSSTSTATFGTAVASTPTPRPPASTPGPGSTQGAATPAPIATDQVATSAPNASGAVAVAGTPAGGGSGVPADTASGAGSSVGPVAASPLDLTPIVLAILGAGLLVAIGIAFAGYEVRRRRSG